MKIKIIEDPTFNEEEIEITCRKITPELEEWVQNYQTKTIIGNRHDKEYPIKIETIVFIETDGNSIYLHTALEAFEVKFKLYELEAILPYYFLRISKSSIINMNQIEAIESGLTSNRSVSFKNTHKIVYVSRKYYPILKEKLNERSLGL